MNRGMYSEKELIEAIKLNDNQALSVLYKINFGMIEHFILSNNGTDEDAKDIYQEAVIAFYEKIRQGKLDLSCQIKTYLYSVCRRLWLKRLTEKRKQAGRIEDFEKYIDIEDELPAIEENEKLFSRMAASLGQLGEPCKTILEDYYIRAVSMDELTEKFGYTNTDNTKNQKYKCLQRLKKIFFSDYKGEQL